MVDMTLRSAFEQMAVSGRGDAGALALGLSQQVTALGLRAFAAKLMHVAIIAPAKLPDIYDNAAAGWRGGAVFPPRPRSESPIRPSPIFWGAFWAMVDEPLPRDRAAFASALDRLGDLLPGDIQHRLAFAALDYPGVAEAAGAGMPAPFDLAVLAGCPAGSLGAAVHRDWVLRGRPVDWSGQDAAGWNDMPAPLGYLHARIAQCQRVWAILGGYTAARDGLAFSAFEVAQFGYHCSSLLLALVVTKLAFDRPAGLETVLESILRGWMHGRETPPLLGVAWEEHWDLPLDVARTRLAITPYASPFAEAPSRRINGAGPH